MKKFLSILMMLMLMFGTISTLSACSKDNAVAEEVPEEVVEDYEEENADEESTKTEEEELEALNLPSLEVDMLQEETPHFYLLKDDKCYSLDGIVSNMELDCYGDSWGSQLTSGGYQLYGQDFYLPDGRAVFYTLGPVPRLEADKSKDSIAVSTVGKDVPSLCLYELEFFENTLPVQYLSEYNRCHLYSDRLGSRRQIEDASNFAVYEIRDGEKGDLIEDYYFNLTGERYLATWYEGTVEQSEELRPTSRLYAFKPGHEIGRKQEGEEAYEIASTMTSNGYAEYDLSGVSPGIYRTNNGGVITIK